jgi:hypothetical protein
MKDEALKAAIKQALALDKKAENARELGLDYEPADGTQVSKVWWDGEKLMAKPIPLEDIYQPVQEPVATLFGSLPVYDTPPAAQRQWVGLTDEEVYPLANEHLHYQMEGYEVSGIYNLAQAIEAKLKEKNT